MEKYFNNVSVILGVIGGVIANLLGGCDVLLKALIAMIVADYITGIMKAIVDKRISSRIGWIGILKKVSVFLVIYVAVTLQELIGDNMPLREMVIVFYISNEGISFLENISAFIELPDKLKDVFLQLRGGGKKEPLNSQGPLNNQVPPSKQEEGDSHDTKNQ